MANSWLQTASPAHCPCHAPGLFVAGSNDAMQTRNLQGQYWRRTLANKNARANSPQNQTATGVNIYLLTGQPKWNRKSGRDTKCIKMISLKFTKAANRRDCTKSQSSTAATRKAGIYMVQLRKPSYNDFRRGPTKAKKWHKANKAVGHWHLAQTSWQGCRLNSLCVAAESHKGYKNPTV